MCFPCAIVIHYVPFVYVEIENVPNCETPLC